ncbi:interferon-inducible GTPase-domain-containing protein [Kalaharituber pfeilii]|nr:interferon-inducible GTPase-domain-containing protein [Kalaharituber pfeilii]
MGFWMNFFKRAAELTLQTAYLCVAGVVIIAEAPIIGVIAAGTFVATSIAKAFTSAPEIQNPNISMVESELNKGDIVTKGTANITQEDHERVKEELGFKDRVTHIAVAGRSGTGKSSLINAFRGLEGDEDSAALTDEVECTRRIERYPDPQCPWIVWYDIPGGGTTEVPDAGYFEKQGLYVMDCIIVLWADRFTELDLEILKGARKWNITALVVRSKSDLTLLNTATRGKLRDQDLYERNLPQARENYIEKSRKSIKDNLAKAQLESHFTDENFFLVSAPNIQQMMIKSNDIPEAKEIEGEAASSSGYGEAQLKKWWEKLQAALERVRNKIQTSPEFIDEKELIARIFGSITETRYRK